MFTSMIIVMTGALGGVSVTPAEMNEMQRWVAAKFELTEQAPEIGQGIEVVNNHGPVQLNARGGNAMRLGKTAYRQGLYCHAPSELIVRLPGPGKTFEAFVGVDTNDQTGGGRGSVVFAVKVGADEIWRSEVLKEGSPAQAVSVDLKGSREFRLMVSDGGDGISCDQADWLDARVTLDDGTVVWVGDMPLLSEPSRYTMEPFFSFRYGDRASSDFLSGWRRDYARKVISDTRHGERYEHRLRWTDPDSKLEVRCVGIEYREYPTVEWTLYFKNNGTENTPILSDIRALDTKITRNEGAEFTLHSIRGDNCTPQSYQVMEETWGANKNGRIANTGGRPTQESFPYFNLSYSDGGMIYVLSWAGQWSTEWQRDGEKSLSIRGGQELTHFTLYPGEEVRTPLVVLQFYKGDWMRAQNVWRRWMLAHNVPQPGGQAQPTMRSLCTGNYYPNLMTESAKEKEFLQRHLDEGINFDCWWQDAGWYPCDGVGWPKTGTWEPDPVRFPHGLRPISDMMHAADKKTMVWFEPERVHSGTWLTEKHPEWVHGGEKGGLLKLSDPACRAWLTDHVDRLLTEQGIDYYRQDFNMDPLPSWRASDTEDRQGITEIRHVEGYFAYWDELLRRHPGMLIDSCASGGRRNDLETLRRAVPLLRSDWYGGPAGQQCLTYGLSLWIPYHGTGVIYEKDLYWWRSSMVAEMSFGPDTAGLDSVDFGLLRKVVDEHRRISPYFLGDFYPLTRYTLEEDQWMAWQFDRPDLGEGVVQAFHRSASIYESVRVKFQGLLETTTYQVSDIDSGEEKSYSGSELMEQGISVRTATTPGASVFVYRVMR